MTEFTPELIAGIVGAALSWLFSWFPILREKFAALKEEVKSLIMLALLAIASVTVYLLALYGVIDTGEPITIWKLITVFFAATTLNQVIFTITPQAKSVKNIKNEKMLSKINEIKKTK